MCFSVVTLKAFRAPVRLRLHGAVSCLQLQTAVMSFPTHLVDRLLSVETAEDEILILGDLALAINTSADPVAHESNLEQFLEEQEFETNKHGLCIGDDCSYVNSLNCLVAYVFERRFGWSETDSSGVLVSDGGQHRLSVVRRSTVGGNVELSKSLMEDLRCKSQINEALDKLITWYLPCINLLVFLWIL